MPRPSRRGKKPTRKTPAPARPGRLVAAKTITLDETLEALLVRVQETRTRLKRAHDVLRASIERLERAIMDVTRSWSGSAAGYHGTLYYRDFETPGIREQFSAEWGGIRGLPPGWEERSPAEVLEAIQSRAGLKIDKITKAAEAISPYVSDLQDDIGSSSLPFDSWWH